MISLDLEGIVFLNFEVRRRIRRGLVDAFDDEVSSTRLTWSYQSIGRGCIIGIGREVKHTATRLFDERRIDMLQAAISAWSKELPRNRDRRVPAPPARRRAVNNNMLFFRTRARGSRRQGEQQNRRRVLPGKDYLQLRLYIFLLGLEVDRCIRYRRPSDTLVNHRNLKINQN